MANPTTNLGMTKPTVGGSTDTWGTTLNENVVDIIDALFSISGTDVTMSDIKFNSMSVQETGAGTDTVKIQAPSAVTTSYTLTMPAAVGSTNQVLSAADGSGTLAWTTPETGDLTAIVAGAGLTGTSLSGPIPTLNVIGTADKVTVSADAVTIASTYVGQTSITTLGTVATGTWNGTAIANANLANSTVSYGGVSLALGASDATPAFNLSDATAYTGDSSLVTTGTITSGTWQGTTVAVNQGGTGLASYAAGDVIYASGATTLAKLAKGSDTEVLTLASGVPTWAAPTVGDITGVTAGTGLSGGGTTGTVTLNVEAAQTQITSVGTLASLAVTGTSAFTGSIGIGQAAGGNRLNVTEDTGGDNIAKFIHSDSSAPEGVYIDLESGAPDNRDRSFLRCDDSGGTRIQLWTDGGATFSGLVYTPATASGGAGLQLPHGTAPSSPNNGDMWTTTAGLYVRINGSTVGPLTA